MRLSGVLLLLLLSPVAPARGQCPEPPPGTLAFASFREGMEDIYTMATDGSGVRRVTHDTFPSSEPSWSPDGTRLAYQSMRPAWRLYTVLPGGSGEALLTQRLAWSPSWSPSGEWIAFSDGGALHLLSPDGGTSREVTRGGSNGRPSWMPDGTHILFHSTRTGNAELFLLDRSSGEIRQLTDSPGRDFHPSPSPDGRRIAFSSNRDGDQEIFVVGVEGGEPTQLTRNEGTDWMPAWSPDGEWLAFVSDRDGNEEIYLMRPDGSCTRRLTRNPGQDIFPAWRPGGSPGDGQGP